MTSNPSTNSSRGFHPSSTFIFKTDVNESTKQIQGQKVICTPEVSLYQYAHAKEAMVPNPITKLVQSQQGVGLGVLSKMAASASANSTDLDLGSTGSASPINRSNSLSSSGSGGSGFQCGFCGKSFQQKNTFQNHLRSHRDVNGPDAYQCDICNKTFAVPARLTRHYRTHTGEKPYQCEYCNKSFSVKENLSVHRRIHTKERPYKCEVCERAFEHSGKLHRHMRIHTGERPHQCQVCQKTFIQSGQLVIHMRTHTGEKPYVCKVCNKGFTCSKQLKVHTRTHTGEKPYSCEICGKSFGYNHVLKLHQVAHYGEKVYKCTLCNSTFNSKKSLETHIKTHSGSDSPHHSLDDVAVVPEQRIVHSPSASSSSLISLTPISSDKENQNMSDSDLSSSLSQSSPLTTPTSPSPPRSHSPGDRDEYILPTTIPSGRANGNGHHSGNHHQSLPYPMLPPSVQVHQAPQSRTTFLYVTSKLPQHHHASGSNSNSSSSSSGDQVLPTMRNGNGNSNINFKTFGFNGQGHSRQPSSNGNGNGNGNFDDRDKHFLQSASIRDKVLASIEKFGYGLNGSGSDSNSSHYSTNSFSQQSQGARRNSIPENLTMSNGNGGGKLAGNAGGRNFFNPYARAVGNNGSGSSSLRTIAMMKDHQQRSAGSPLINQAAAQRHFNESSNSNDNDNDEESFDRLKSMYPSGGVLALALTRGSKVAATASQLGPHSHGHSVSVTPINHYSNCVSPPPRSDSPQELCIDFSRHGHGDRDRADSFSCSPSPPPRQNSPSGYSEGSGSYEELSDECAGGDGRPMRSRPSLGGPRKRSSLILEKYAQESVPSIPQQQQSQSEAAAAKSESILSQRLRLSSVIQYAEKCT